MHNQHDDPEIDQTGRQTSQDGWTAPTTRKNFLKGAVVAGAGATSLGAFAPAAAIARGRKKGPTHGDLAILKAAQIAEALAVTTYTNIINTAPFFKNIPSDDQAYLQAARQEEMSHYLLEEGVTKKPSAFTTFYYPPKMFADAQTTLDILVTLEDAFIAAYLDRRPRLQHRRPAGHGGANHGHRVRPPHARARDRARRCGRGWRPDRAITGFQKTAEPAGPPNNNGYERTLRLSNIGQAVEALLPFVEKTAAEKAGFDTTKPYPFAPFTPRCRARSANSTR